MSTNRDPIGELRLCLEHASNDRERISAILRAGLEARELRPREVYEIAAGALPLAVAGNDPDGLMWLQWLIGDCALRTGRLREAQSLLDASCESFREKDDQSGLAHGLRSLGTLASETCEYAMAHTHFGAALVSAESLDDSAFVARLYGDIGRLYLRTNDFASADECLERARSIAAVNGDPDLRAHIVICWCIRFSGSGDLPEALAACDAASAYAPEALRSEILMERAIALFFGGDAITALPLFEEALVLFERSGDAIRTGEANYFLGRTKRFLGDMAGALAHLYEAFETAETIAISAATCSTLTEIGLCYAELHRFEEARERYDDALAIARLIERPDFEAGCHWAIGTIMLESGRLGDAETSLRQALEIYDAIQRYSLSQSTRLNLAVCLHDQGRIDEALELARETYRNATDHENHFVRGNCCVLLGDIFATPSWSLRDTDRAEEYYREAVACAERTGDARLRLNVLDSMEKLYSEMGRWNEALDAVKLRNELRDQFLEGEAQRQAHLLEQSRRTAHAEKEHSVERVRRREAELRSELLEIQLERKQQEVASTAMHLARQTELIARFRNDLIAIVRGEATPDNALRRVREKLMELPCETIDWSKFDAEFQATHPTFRTNLLARYPALSRTEVKVCSLLRLRLTSLDIGKLLRTSDRSVEWHRSNIRKKLGLNPGEDLFAALEMVE